MTKVNRNRTRDPRPIQNRFYADYMNKTRAIPSIPMNTPRNTVCGGR